jgi:hypothetical protein
MLRKGQGHKALVDLELDSHVNSVPSLFSNPFGILLFSMSIDIKKKAYFKLGIVVHASNPSYSGGRGRRIIV